MLGNLNQEQKKAVQTTEGALLVLAGAGTGKTKVLTTRLAYILNQGLAYPWQVLALTFTNKAANEMKRRIRDLSDGKWYADDVWCGTFHSICLRILRSNYEHAGLQKNFLIYGEDEQKTILKSVFADMGLDSKDFSPADWIERISAIKDKGIKYTFDFNKTTENIFNLYNAALQKANAVDFGDIILRVLKLFESNPDVLKRYQDQFKYIMVDEFQDTNKAQMQFLEFLTRGKENPNICCVGDDDQSIYSWRGAEIRNILEFQQVYKKSNVIRLETNYRSTSNILNAANSLIRHNEGRLGKDLRTYCENKEGEPVYVLTLPTAWDETRLIADTISKKTEQEKFSDYAILIRAGSLSRSFEEEFTSRGIPYRLVGATKFYDRAEIKDSIAYLRLLVYPFDDLSFLRVIAKPRRGFGDAALAKIRASAENMMQGLKIAELSGKQKQNAEDFLKAFDFDWQSMAPAEAAQRLLEDSGYLKMWRESKESEASDRLDNIKELIGNVISKYDTLPDFLEHAALMTADDNDSDDATKNDTDAVSIMTIHAAKGLEFDTVFLPAWEEGIFPNEMSKNDGGLEEERRLAYVALTRAKRRAIISNAICRNVFGERKYNSPSRFITEMDNRFLDFQGVSQTPYNSYNNYSRVSASYESRPKPKTIKSDKMVGKLVWHSELGNGTVIAEDGDILTVAFGGKGIKKVAKQFVKLK